MGFIAERFDEKSFFSTILGFNPFWDNKHYNKNISQNIVNLSHTNKIHLKCDVFDGSIQNGLGHPILFIFVLDAKLGYKLFCEPETLHLLEINKSVLNTITLYLKNDNNDEVDFNGERLTFKLQMIQILSY